MAGLIIYFPCDLNYLNLKLILDSSFHPPIPSLKLLISNFGPRNIFHF